MTNNDIGAVRDAFFWKKCGDKGWHVTIQDDTYKLIVWDYGSLSENYDLYDLVNDFWETADLWDSTDLDIVAIRDTLKSAIDTQLGTSACLIK